MSAPDDRARTLARLVLGLLLAGAGVAHLTVQREEFRAQVPDWFPIDEDPVVLASGGVEILLGLALVFTGERRALAGVAAAGFFVLVFPGNVAQFVEKTDAFGLDTDAKRFGRLFFQPVLVAWALWSTGGYRWLRDRFR